MDNIFLAMSGVVACSAVLAWLASQFRQPILIAYFLCGIILGPTGLSMITSVKVLHDISQIGVMLLLFLAGLVLHPDRLQKFFKVSSIVTIVNSIISWILTFAILTAWGYSAKESAIAAIALMFSSTILVVKLLPTTTLHQQKMGSICIAILIAQDLLAVSVLLFVGPEAAGASIMWLPAKAILLVVFAVLFEQYVLRWMMLRSDRYNEVLVMLCLGWCAGLAVLAEELGIPHEVGAFVAGVTIARGKIALIFSEELKPLRDFFLMFFFFALGASLEFLHLKNIWGPAILSAVIIIFSRPVLLSFLFQKLGEEKNFSNEISIRLGQASEFALVIAAAAQANNHISVNISQFIQLTAITTMLASSYIVIMKHPTPIGVKPNLQRD